MDDIRLKTIACNNILGCHSVVLSGLTNGKLIMVGKSGEPY